MEFSEVRIAPDLKTVRLRSSSGRTFALCDPCYFPDRARAGGLLRIVLAVQHLAFAARPFRDQPRWEAGRAVLQPSLRSGTGLWPGGCVLWVSFGAFPLMWGMIVGGGQFVDRYVSPLRYGGVSMAIGFALYVLLYLLLGCTAD